MKVKGGVPVQALARIPARKPGVFSRLRPGFRSGSTLLRDYQRGASESFQLASQVNPLGGADQLGSDHFLRCPTYQSRPFVRAQLDNVLFTRHARALIAVDEGFIEEFNVGGAAGVPEVLLESDFVRRKDEWRTRPGSRIERVSGLSIPLCHYGQDAFGHFVLDGLLQIYLHREAIANGEAKVVHWPFANPWPTDLLALCGVDSRHQRILRQPLALLERASLTSAMAGHGVYFPAAYSVSFFEWLRERLGGPEVVVKPFSSVYIRRSPQDSRRIINQDALELLLADHGFEILDPIKTPVAEQALRIARSERLMAPWGSGLTLSPLLTGRRQVLELTPMSVTDPWFLRQAAVHGLDYIPIPHPSDGAGAILADLDLINRVLAEGAA